MKIQRILTGALALSVALASLYAGPIPVAHAATITVNTTDDELNSDGDCSLREAIQAANTDTAVSGCAAGSGADTITLPAGYYTLTIAGTNEEDNATGDLDITDDLTINGGGSRSIRAATTSTNGIDRVLDVHSGVTVEMNGLWIYWGKTPGTPGEYSGGGIRNDTGSILTLNNCYIHSNTADQHGGGIYNLGTLTLNNSNVIGNSAGYNGGGIFNSGTLTLTNLMVDSNTVGWDGGGIFNNEILTLDNCNVRHNTAERDGGGIYTFGTLTLDNSTVADNTADSDHDLDGDGGGIWNGVWLTLNNSTVADNTAIYGGGIYNDGDNTVLLSKTTVADNGCGYNGGGIYNDNPSAILILDMSTVNDNDAGMGSGGGIYNSGGDLSLDKCTVSGNTSGQSGGGIWNNGPLWLDFTTVADNAADVDADGSGDGGGIYVAGGTAQTRNTIIGDNSDWQSQAPDCWGTLTLLGHTLLEESNGCSYSLGGVGNMIGVEPVLGALGDNGGPTWTHALLAGSKAIDSIPDGTSGCQAGLSTDQRGYPRAGGAGYGGSSCDIGAYEYDTAPRVVHFSAGTYNWNENGGTATITVVLSPASGNTVTVDYATSDGTATAGSDYTAVSGTLTFNPGITSRTFTVAILEDTLDEADETVTLTLSNPTNATIGTWDPATLTIADNDPLPTVRFSRATYSVNEGAGSATVAVNLSAPSGRLVEVNCATSDGTATAGSDYTTASTTLYFYPGDTSKTFTVPILDDGLDEPNETVILTLSDATNATIGGTNPATLTIVDDDGAGFFVYLPLILKNY